MGHYLITSPYYISPHTGLHRLGQFSLPLEHTEGEEQHQVQQSQQSQGQGHQDETSPVTLQQLFALFEQLRERPELIAVVHDFLHEVTRA